MIATSDVEHFQSLGWVLTDTLDPDLVRQLSDWVSEVASWPVDGEGWLHHREQTDDGPALCRSENLVPFHDGLRDLLTGGELLETASTLLGEPAVLYKEKINYKQPGGAGYAPHQDAPAYPFVDQHVSAMVPIDDATTENGCLEVVSGAHGSLLETDGTGCMRAEIVEGTGLEHETLGAAYVSTLFPAGVTMPIGLHVLAKRYLCAVEPDYPDALSAGSAASLSLVTR